MLRIDESIHGSAWIDRLSDWIDRRNGKLVILVQFPGAIYDRVSIESAMLYV